MGKLIVVVGCPLSRTHYTSTLLLCHPQINPPSDGKWEEPSESYNLLTKEGFISFTGNCNSQFTVVNNHGWSFFLDLIRENSDCYIVETQRDCVDLLYRYVQWFLKVGGWGDDFPRFQFLKSPWMMRWIHKAGWDIGKSAHFTERMAAYIFANRFACLQRRDVVLKEHNYQNGIEKIQSDLDLNVIAFDDLVCLGECDPQITKSRLYRRGFSLRWDPPKVRLEGEVRRLIDDRRDNVEFWLDKIREMSDQVIGDGV